jgi:hypothetical protein
MGRMKNGKKGEGKEEAGWAGLRFQLGFGPLPNRNLKILFFFKTFYNLQTNLSSKQI